MLDRNDLIIERPHAFSIDTNISIISIRYKEKDHNTVVGIMIIDCFISISICTLSVSYVITMKKNVLREGKKSERSNVVKKGTENEKRSRTREREPCIHTYTYGDSVNPILPFSYLLAPRHYYYYDIVDVVVVVVVSPLIIIAACARSRSPEILNIFVSSLNNNSKELPRGNASTMFLDHISRFSFFLD